jgi:hypothetical protein
MPISAQNRAKSLAAAKQRIVDARKALRDAEAEHTRLTGRDTVSPFAQLAVEIDGLVKIRR